MLALVAEEASANGTSRKWLDKQTATLGLLREIVGDETPVRSIDFDACLRVRSTLARVPANRSKLYKRTSRPQPRKCTSRSSGMLSILWPRRA